MLRLARRYEGNTPRVLYSLAYGCLSLDPESPAPIGILERLLFLDPDSHTALHLLGKAFLRQKRADEAVVMLRRAVELDPENSGYRTELGRALIAGSDSNTAEAIEVLTVAARLDSGNAMARYELGKLLMSQDRLAEALPVLEATIKVAPEFREAFYVLGQLYARIGQRQTARKYLDLFNEKLVAAKARSAVGEGFSRDN
jgi:cytochrome c-type biogenesis protein CcmH/NrfG